MFHIYWLWVQFSLGHDIIYMFPTITNPTIIGALYEVIKKKKMIKGRE